MKRDLHRTVKPNTIAHGRRGPRLLAVAAKSVGPSDKDSVAARQEALDLALAPFLAHWIRDLLASGDVIVVDQTVHVASKAAK